MKSLLTIFAYLKDSHAVDDGLQHESVAVQSQVYTMIMDGLQLFDFNVCRDIFFEEPTKQLFQKVSNFVKHNKIEIIWNCSKSLIEDKYQRESLLAMVHSIEPLAGEVAEMVSPEASVNEKLCHHLLGSSSFLTDLAEKVLFWCTERLHYFCQKFQFALLHNLNHKLNTESAICAFTSWIMKRTNRAFAECDWKTIQQIIQIAEKLTSDDQLQIIVEAPSSLVIVIQTIELSDDLEDVNFILENVSSEGWLRYLIISIFLELLQNHYSVNVEEEVCDQLLKLDIKLLQIFYNVFVSDQYNQLAGDSQCLLLAGFISLEQFSTISNWLSLIEPCPSVYTVLCRTSLALWEKELLEIYFEQYLDYWTDISEADKQKTLYLMNRVRLAKEVDFSDFISLLCTDRRKYVNDSLKNTQVLLELFEDLYYERVSLAEVETIVSSYDYMHWLNRLDLVKYKL